MTKCNTFHLNIQDYATCVYLTCFYLLRNIQFSLFRAMIKCHLRCIIFTKLPGQILHRYLKPDSGLNRGEVVFICSVGLNLQAKN